MKEYLMRFGQEEDVGQLDRLCNQLQKTSTREEVNSTKGHRFSNKIVCNVRSSSLNILNNGFVFHQVDAVNDLLADFTCMTLQRTARKKE